MKAGIYLGDCMEVMRQMSDNSIDAIVTDPPYGLSSAKNSGKTSKGGFMGKKWDYDVPRVEIWEEALRVLKPGGHLLSFAGTRTQHRMAVNIEDAGFEIRNMIAWVYGSGFPKSLNVALDIDRQACRKRLTEKLGRKPTKSEFKEAWKNFRKIIGEKKRGDVQRAKKSGSTYAAAEANKNNEAIFGYGIEKITTPATPKAKQWDGWGTALKPALEPITVARKPLSENTVAANILKWGTGGINIDGCRVEYGDETDKRIGTDAKAGGSKQSIFGDFSNIKDKNIQMYKDKGRFPSNLILDGSDEVLELFPETKSGYNLKHYGNKRDGKAESVMKNFEMRDGGFGDKGSASRFFFKAEFGKEEYFNYLCTVNKYNELCHDQSQIQLSANIAKNNLFQKEVIEDFVLKLVAIEDSQEDNQLKNMITPFMNEMRKILKSKDEKNIETMLTIGIKCVQELKHTITERLNNVHVKFVEIQRLINTTMIIQNLLNINGFVEVVISDITLSNMVHGEKGSRFKYCAKASKQDRDEGLDGVEEKRSAASEFRPNHLEKSLKGEGGNPYGRWNPVKNNHPTVKPTKLMQYLVRLVTPPNGTVLDLFMGSGSTGKACKLEGFDFIGIELDPEYFKITEKRINLEKTKLQLF